MEENKVTVKYLVSAIEAILFASGDPVPAARIALVLDSTADEVFNAADVLASEYEAREAGIRLLRLDDKLQICSAPEFAEDIIRVLEQRRPPKLSPAAMESLAVIAYYQPVTRAYIDKVRGVDSSYTVSVLLDKGLIEIGGHMETPGRPALYQTSEAFLRTFGISELKELPRLPDMTGDEGIIALQNAIDELRCSKGEQLEMSI